MDDIIFSDEAFYHALRVPEDAGAANLLRLNGDDHM
jgi:hypothetical protein